MSDNPDKTIDLLKIMELQLFPTITFWNRLEGRPRTHDFSRALKAEVRDALWMLTKQWQMGEFRGDDAGSPILAKIKVATAQLNKYQPGDHSAIPFPEETPLEAIVERRFVPPQKQSLEVSLDLRLQMGRQWLKMIDKVGKFASSYIERYPLPDPEKEGDATIRAHPAVRAQFSAVAGRLMDGAALYAYLANDPIRHAYDDIKEIPESVHVQIDKIAKKFMKWFESLYTLPSSEDDAWKPSCLEYQFACSSSIDSGERVYSADEYSHGRLDWYNLDTDPERKILNAPVAKAATNSQPPIQSFIPSAITFDGMPNTRWWTFEDGRTNFGDIKPNTTDLAKLLLMEFGLVYANDWFLFPLKLPVGSIAMIKGLVVTNVFGERLWIEPAGKGKDEDWQRWSMFTTSIKGQADVPAEMIILLLPTVPLVQESAPLEEIMFVRDEVANMVWGIEKIVQLADGSSKPGGEAAIELMNHLQREIEQEIKMGKITLPTSAIIAPIRYKVMNTVPENWIPFIPVHLDGDNREIQLQRAAMPRILEGTTDTPPVQPRTMLLREGLPGAYFLHEEEVPRAGVIVTQSFQRTRWHDGKVIIWLGARRQTGRGEASSGLKFDQIVPVEGYKSD